MAKVKRKSFEFDLSKDKLEKCGFKVNSKNVNEKLEPYKQIETVMKALRFEHRQGSVYYSKEPLTRPNVDIIIEKLDSQLSWLNECIKKFDVADVVLQHDLRETWEKVAAVRKMQLIPEPTKEPSETFKV